MKAIKDIVKELGLDEDFIRVSLDGIVTNYDSVTEISDGEYNTLLKIFKAESQAQLTGSQPSYEAELQEELEPEKISQLAEIRREVLEVFPQNFGELSGLIVEQLAYINAQKLVADYKLIHSETVEAGLSDYHQSFAEQASSILKAAQSRDPHEFLRRQGIKKKRPTATEVLNEFQSLINSFSA
ncbi:hypothetical protein NIES2100_73670 [Calothrix sp. NIES-2100]|uniref:hypothetical protein n=1 Tax=Calothrix sp. NIES-2100 TaxID=1954172 RepID=UPI000B5E45BC|nr:hypothetical protein NIES2100_73670 [Calothrix sp. NIES-2100]